MFNWIHNLAIDIRLTARMLMKSPGFTMVVLMTLALGIGANTLVYSVVDGVLLQPLPYPESDRLMLVSESLPKLFQAFSLPANPRHFLEWKKKTTSFLSLSIIDVTNVTLSGSGDPESYEQASVSSNFFETLDIQPFMGRPFTEGEDNTGLNDVVIITNELWIRRFEANPAIIGKSIVLDGNPVTIVGVMPQGFYFPNIKRLYVNTTSTTDTPQLFRPIAIPAEQMEKLMGVFNYGVIGRLKPNVTITSALSELNTIAGELTKMSGTKIDLRASIISLHEALVKGSKKGLILFQCAVISVLFIACLNLAMLALTHAERREYSIAIYLMLGASRLQLLKKYFLEYFLLALLGGLLGMGLAFYGLDVFIHIIPMSLPRLDEVHVNNNVMMFSLALTLFMSFIFCIIPLWRITKCEPYRLLQVNGSMTFSTARSRFRHVLISVEVSFCVVLLVITAEMMCSFINVLKTNKQILSDDVLTVSFMLSQSKYPDDKQRSLFQQRLLARIASQSGVASAAFTSTLPLQGEAFLSPVSSSDDNVTIHDKPTANCRYITQHYFYAMGIPLLAGRTFNENDTGKDKVIISESLARILWAHLSEKEIIGHNCNVAQDKNQEVIGIVNDVRTGSDAPLKPTIYILAGNKTPPFMSLVVRAKNNPLSIAGEIRMAVHEIDSSLPIPRFRTLQEILSASIVQRSFQIQYMLIFGIAAIILAAIGIYGVASYSITRRTQELGIRMALGAQPGHVRFMVLGEELAPVISGLVIGLIVLFMLGKLIRSMLYEVSPYSPIIITSIVGGVLITALLVCIVPVSHITKMNPTDALKAR